MIGVGFGGRILRMVFDDEDEVIILACVCMVLIGGIS